MKPRETQIKIPNYSSNFALCVLNYLFLKSFIS